MQKAGVDPVCFLFSRQLSRSLLTFFQAEVVKQQLLAKKSLQGNKNAKSRSASKAKEDTAAAEAEMQEARFEREERLADAVAGLWEGQQTLIHETRRLAAALEAIAGASKDALEIYRVVVSILFCRPPVRRLLAAVDPRCRRRHRCRGPGVGGVGGGGREGGGRGGGCRRYLEGDRQGHGRCLISVPPSRLLFCGLSPGFFLN